MTLGSMEVASASDMITDSLSALGRDSDYATTLVDQVAAASSKANASVSQMGSAILTVGGTAKVFKNGTTELNTVLGLLADNGVKGAEGGTALRNVILSLAAPTDKAAATLKELGVKALGSSGDLRSMRDIFTDLNKALSGMSEGKKTEVLNEIFNKTDLKSVNALLATNIDRWEELSGAIEHSKYAAELMADTQLDKGYQKDLAKRAGEIANSYKLFAEVPAAETISGKDLLNNLRDQIDSVRKFYDNLEELSRRGVGDALVDEIRAMGVGASDELDALLKLSDKKLAQYADLFGEKQDLANSIAVRELSGFREETDAKIRESLDSIESLYDEYAPVIGMSLPQGLAEGIRNGMKEALDAAGELANALQAKFERMGGGAGTLNLLGAAADNARILAVEPASQSRQSSAVREESYGYDNRAANAGLRSAPIEFNVYNEVGGRRVARLQQRYTDAETARRGPSFLRT